MTKLLKTAFQQAVSTVNRFVPLRPSLPVLGNVYLKGEKGRLLLRATNLETSIELSLPAKTEKEFETTAPAKLLVEFVNNITEEEITLQTEKESLLVQTPNTKGVLTTISPAEFPTPPFQNGAKTETKLKAQEFYQAVVKVAFAASQDEGKPVLNSINLTKEGAKLSLVATDGYRLARQILKQDAFFADLLVPARIFVEALKVADDLGEAEIEFSSDSENNQVLLKGESFQVASRLINGTYPNYRQIIPTSFVTTATVQKEALIGALKTVAVFARDLGNVVTFSLSGKQSLVLSATTAQVGEGSSEVAAEITGDALSVSFNSHYFGDGLAALKSDRVKIEFSGQLSPALVTAPDDPDFIYLVMPVKPQK